MMQSIFREIFGVFGYLRVLKGVAILRDEGDFPTVRFQKCRGCGEVFTGSLSGENRCPKCHASTDALIPEGGRFKLEMSGLHALFSIVGSLHKIQELEEFRVLIEDVMAKEIESIAFYLKDSSFLSSSLINLLVRNMQALSQRGKPTYIISNDIAVLESLQMTNLDQVMKIIPNMDRYRALLT